jgi:hypothetical protein
MLNRILSKSLLPAAVLVGVGVGFALAAQPRMEAALRALQNARGELQAALPDKGGHRVAAIDLVDRAIGEVRAGMADSANQ